MKSRYVGGESLPCLPVSVTVTGGNDVAFSLRETLSPGGTYVGKI